MLFPPCPSPRCCCCLISQCCALSYTYINIDNEPERERERERVQISGVTCRGACAFIQHKYKYKHGWVTAVEGTEKEERETDRSQQQTERQLLAEMNAAQAEWTARECGREAERDSLVVHLSLLHTQTEGTWICCPNFTLSMALADCLTNYTNL